MAKAKSFVEEVELQGHIIDSLLLPKVLDEIITRGGSYIIKDMKLGKRQVDPSNARIEIKADGQDQLDDILGAVHEHGAISTKPRACEYEAADMNGAFPDASTAPPITARRFGSARTGSTWTIRRWIAASCSSPHPLPLSLGERGRG